MRAITVAVAFASMLASVAPAFAQDDDRPTIQRRFASKDKSLYAHVTGATHIRNDFYTSYGAGADVGFYFSESLGLELRAMFLETNLSRAAVDVKERTGLTPDARPQSLLLVGGPRFSLGYGKILAFKKFVVHFDPQFTLLGGIARAERRIVPSVVTGLSLLLHFRWGLQAKLDLGTTIQAEKRDRGWVTSVGFLPTIGLGWNFSFVGDDPGDDDG